MLSSIPTALLLTPTLLQHVLLSVVVVVDVVVVVVMVDVVQVVESTKASSNLVCHHLRHRTKTVFARFNFLLDIP
jgi:hypothetical protein